MLWKLGVLSAVVAAAFLAINRIPDSQALQGPGIIRITDREVAFTTVDLGRPGRTPGDVEVMRRLLYNRKITPKALGHADLVCTYTVGSWRNCTGTYELPAGKIVVAGPMQYRQFFQLAVVGGTRRYVNVRGTLTVTSLIRNPRRDVVFFRLIV